jgi:hypothetical protein
MAIRLTHAYARELPYFDFIQVTKPSTEHRPPLAPCHFNPVIARSLKGTRWNWKTRMMEYHPTDSI